MGENQMYLLQLLGAVACGGFVGEFYRTAKNSEICARVFVANFLAGVFLSMIMGYLVFYFTNNREISILIGALLSYQDEAYLSNLSKKVVKNIMNEGKDKND